MKFKVGDMVRYKDEFYAGIGKILVDESELDGTLKIDTDEYGDLWFRYDEVFLLTSCVDTEDNQNKHMEICNQLNKIYVAKNKDYGNSFGEQYQEHGITSCVIRLDDKMRRFKKIAKNEAHVKNETIEDTLMDMANYAIMTLMEVRKGD